MYVKARWLCMNIHINFISNILNKRMTYMSISYWVTEQPKHKVTGWHNLVVKRGELLAPTETWKVFKGIMEKEGVNFRSSYAFTTLWSWKENTIDSNKNRGWNVLAQQEKPCGGKMAQHVEFAMGMWPYPCGLVENVWTHVRAYTHKCKTNKKQALWIFYQHQVLDLDIEQDTVTEGAQ